MLVELKHVSDCTGQLVVQSLSNNQTIPSKLILSQIFMRHTLSDQNSDNSLIMEMLDELSEGTVSHIQSFQPLRSGRILIR